MFLPLFRRVLRKSFIRSVLALVLFSGFLRPVFASAISLPDLDAPSTPPPSPGQPPAPEAPSAPSPPPSFSALPQDRATLRKVADRRWSRREIGFFLDECDRIYDQENDFALHKQPGEFPRLQLFCMREDLVEPPAHKRAARSIPAAAERGRAAEQLEQLARALSHFDLVTMNLVWPKQPIVLRQERVLSRARELHPGIRFLAYVPTDLPPLGPDRQGTFLAQLHASLPDSLKIMVAGEWAGDGWMAVNYQKPPACDWFVDQVERFVFQRAPGLYDGLLLDQIKARHLLAGRGVFQQRFQSRVDLDGDRRPDLSSHGAAWIEDWYIRSKIDLLRVLRARLGDRKLLVGIGGPWTLDEPERHYLDYANGQIEEGLFTRSRSPRRLLKAIATVEENAYARPERLFLLASKTRRRHDQIPLPDRREARYGLALACIGGAHWGYDSGGAFHGHQEIWWMPEYNCNLGKPLADAVDHRQEKYIERRFERGIVVVNRLLRRADAAAGEYFPRFCADLYETPATTARIDLPRPLYSMAQEKEVSHLDLGIYDADILLDLERHPRPRQVGPGPIYWTRAETFDPWLAELRRLCRERISSGEVEPRRGKRKQRRSR